jgi:radical SAM superfamily enzyme YgiQ (UPF0313 family)
VKVLLLNPPTIDEKQFIREGRCTQEQGVWATLWPPLSLATIGAVLEEDGRTVKIVDCPAQEISWHGLTQVITTFLPDVVIWSTGTPSIQSDLSLAAVVKGCNNRIATAVFGTHVTVFDKQSLESFPELTYIIRNEPEMTVRDLVRSLAEGSPLEGVSGLTFRSETGAVVANPSRPFIEDLDSLPLPSWHLLDLNRYRLPLKGKGFLMVAPLRGCPFNCSFCTCQTYYGKRLRKRSLESVIKEIEHGIEQFGIRDFFFWAETFVVDKDYVEQLCSAIIERGLSIAWTSNSRVDTVDLPLLRLMAQAGCWMISFGIESGSQDVLDESHKGTTPEQAFKAVSAAHEVGIKTVGHFILGLPGETRESLEDTIEYARKLHLDLAQFYCAVPFPGSRLYERALQEGWIAHPDFKTFNQDHALMRLPTITPEEVNRYRALAYKRFYFNLGSIVRTVKLTNWRDLKGLLTSAKDFWRWLSK